MNNLHPLQVAWMAYGCAQCGFCSPGFIISAKVLLEQNPNPTRQEVRDWFNKNRNLCRCTGYKPLIDATMAAAAVMRGEMTAEDLMFKPTDNVITGTTYARPSAAMKVTGTWAVSYTHLDVYKRQRICRPTPTWKSPFPARPTSGYA